MQKKLFSGLFLVILLNVLVKPFYIFGIDAQVQNQVSTEDYGLYFTLLNLSFLFNVVLDVGINNYNTRNIAQHPQLLSRYLGSIISLRSLLGLIYLVITLSVGFTLGFSEFAIHLLFLLAINQFFAGFIFYFRSNFAGMHLFKTDAIFSVLDRLILIGCCLILLYSSVFETEITISYFVYAQTFAYALSALIAFMYTLYLKPTRLKVNRLLSFAILKQSAPYALLILLMMLYNRTDVIMIDLLLEEGKTQAGVYAQGFRLLDAVTIFALLFAGVLLPSFSRLIKQKESVESVLKTAAQLLISVSLLVACLGFVYSKEIMELIYVKDTALSWRSFQWIIFSFLPISITYIFGTLLTANGSLKVLNYMAFGGLLLNLFLNFFMIPVLQSEGAALATFLTQIITAIAQLFLAVSIFKLSINFKVILKLTLLFILLFFGIQFLKTELSLLFGTAITVVFFLFYLLLSKMIDLRKIKSLF